MARRVFVSHNSVDHLAAAEICRALEARAIPCWIAPRDIAPGTDWADAIIAGIAETDMLLLVHSDATSTSAMVRRELNAALAAAMPILPVRTDGAVPRDGVQFYLSATHWLDAVPGLLADHLDRIGDAVAALLADLVNAGEPAAAPGTVPTLAQHFPDRPAIAVLPFRNLGAAAPDDLAADALTDDLIAAISAWRVFPVIARNSVFAAHSATTDPRILGRQLGARYIVTGALQHVGSAIRVTVELIDVATADVLMAERFDRPAADTLGMQDEIVRAIGGILAPEIFRQERERAARRQGLDATAHQLVQHGQWHRARETRADFDAAEALFHRALAVDPQYAPALASLSVSRNFAAIRRWTDDVPASFRQSYDFARQAVAADRRNPQCHFALGIAHMNLGDRDQAVAALRHAIALNPSHVSARSNLGQLFNYLNRPADALAELDIALRLSPHDPYRYQWLPYLAASHYLSGDYRACLTACEQALRTNPEFPLAVRYLVAALGQLDRAAEAAAPLALMRRIDGNLARLEAMTRRLFVPAAADHLLTGFRRAGFD